ncbi:MAG: rRNA maturation RNase YbeY [Gammaproteobacteria bacterium]|jgi:probable rRNA maturation factor|nr:rRNA maturation RNase YbeY [Gammaproteobacteria bacterium]MBT7307204.1 rRNA maturation RNase YbeY [Gammaproteobacteria bacterium]
MELILQQAVEGVALPDEVTFSAWMSVVAEMMATPSATELTIRIVDEAEGEALNERYRQKPGATNVLSFPFEAPEGVPLLPLPLGDLVICAPIIVREAEQQGKVEQAHWAHMVVHGLLHLLGMDHLTEAEAMVMEAKEREVLSRLGFSDPYAPH